MLLFWALLKAPAVAALSKAKQYVDQSASLRSDLSSIEEVGNTTRLLETRRKTLGDTHPDTVESMQNLASLLQSRGNCVDAEPLCLEAFHARRKLLGDTHPFTLQSIQNLAALLQAQGKLQEVQILHRHLLDCKQVGHYEKNPDMLVSDLQAQRKRGSCQRISKVMVLEALETLNQHSGSTMSHIKRTIQEADPCMTETDLKSLPLILKKLERVRSIERTKSNTFRTKLAGRASDMPTHLLRSYFMKMFQIADMSKSGRIRPLDLHKLLKLSGFRFKPHQLQKIAASVKVTPEADVNYVPLIADIISIVKHKAVHSKPAAPGRHEEQQKAGEEDWDLFASAMNALTIDDGEAV